MLRNLAVIFSMLSVVLLSGCGESENDSGMIGSTMKSMERDALPGAEVVRRQCGTCHYLDKSVRKVGPSLKGIIGRAPSIRSIPVDVWDETSMDAWIANPTEVDPKTRMKIPGIKDAEKRKLIIEYLKHI